MSSDQLAAFITSGDLYLFLAALSFLLVRALDRFTPDTMFTSALSKRVANAAISAVSPILVVLPAGLIAHFSPLKLLSLSLAAFFGSSAFNAWLPAKKSADAPLDPTKAEKAQTVVNIALAKDDTRGPTGSMRRRPNGLALALSTGALLGIVFLVSCTAQQGAAVVSAVPEIVKDVCDVAETQPEPAWVTLVCTAFDAKGTPVRKYSATIPKTKLAACPKTDGKVAP